jgi:hypothetical protein
MMRFHSGTCGVRDECMGQIAATAKVSKPEMDAVDV